MDGPASSRMKMQLDAHPVFYGSGSDGSWGADDHMLESCLPVLYKHRFKN